MIIKILQKYQTMGEALKIKRKFFYSNIFFKEGASLSKDNAS